MKSSKDKQIEKKNTIEREIDREIEAEAMRVEKELKMKMNREKTAKKYGGSAKHDASIIGGGDDDDDIKDLGMVTR